MSIDKTIKYVKAGDIEFVKKWLQRSGNNINKLSSDITHNKYYTTLLNVAVCENDYGIASLLLENGADPDKCRNSNKGNHNVPIGAACEIGNIRIVKELIEHGCDINCRIGKELLSPLMIAVKNNNTDVVELLIANGAHLDAVAKKGKDIFSMSKSSIMDTCLSTNVKSKESWIILSDCEIAQVKTHYSIAQEVKEVFNFNAMNVTTTIRNTHTNVETSFRSAFSDAAISVDDVYTAMEKINDNVGGINKIDVQQAIGIRNRNIVHRRKKVKA